MPYQRRSWKHYTKYSRIKALLLTEWIHNHGDTKTLINSKCYWKEADKAGRSYCSKNSYTFILAGFKQLSQIIPFFQTDGKAAHIAKSRIKAVLLIEQYYANLLLKAVTFCKILRSQNIFNMLRFPQEYTNLPKTHSLTAVSTYTSFVWAVKLEDLKEHSHHLPTAREHPMNWCNTCAECKERAWLDIIVPVSLQNLNMTGLA